MITAGRKLGNITTTITRNREGIKPNKMPCFSVRFATNIGLCQWIANSPSQAFDGMSRNASGVP